MSYLQNILYFRFLFLFCLSMIYRVQCTMMTTSQWRLKSLPTWLFAQQLAPQVNKTTQSSTLKRIKGSLVTNKQRAGRFVSKMRMKEDYIFEILVAISILSLKWKLSINCTFHIRILKLYEILPIAGISARSLRALSNRSIWWRHNIETLSTLLPLLWGKSAGKRWFSHKGSVTSCGVDVMIPLQIKCTAVRNGPICTSRVII